MFERGPLLFIFNFHPQKSFADYRVGVEQPGEYRLVLNSDSKQFMGHGRLDEQCSYFTEPLNWDCRMHSLLVYIPSRTAIILAPKQ